MPIKSPLTIVLGTANVGDSSRDKTVRYDAPNEVNAYLDAFYERGGRQIDTARSYSPEAHGSSEERLGAVEAGTRFSIATKVLSLAPGSHSKEKIKENIDTSLSSLKIPKIDIEYLHMPDRTTPFEEALAAVNEAYTQGKFERFGLSNYTAEEVDKIVQICEEKDFVKPSVYQGQYNPIIRSGEKELFPVLRKHGIAFYAWSPAAGGFFAGNHKHVQPGARYDSSTWAGKVYASVYLKPNIEAATDRAIGLVAKHGINGHAAALRWTVYHSTLKEEFRDAVIIAASSVAQLNSNIDMIEQGPLPGEVVDAMETLYKEVEGTEFPYHL
ncbi:hypothetical protein AYO21_00418 [Fonsecaea monophora]|uniref:NADP-dependent oxidoreductase domain-containing protein n=1 Tax=Fonsecaea monophora TaxID=254056 RepID=A0A177FNB9_9EURO|nr:hypothetical protein AYO21_00418 [Fonsecaea monophora]OAG45070.1 hypothetical protein AYO21_00418 [Fonsecaea monophora]